MTGPETIPRDEERGKSRPTSRSLTGDGEKPKRRGGVEKIGLRDIT